MSQYREIYTDGNAELKHYRKMAAIYLRLEYPLAENKGTDGIFPRFIKGIFSRAVRLYQWINDDSSVDVFPPGHPT
ncbi:MAG: hypothetical protein JSW16_00695 [Dehalococcoidales bacterium]|nr:MAG: hypothetical protein JSW16_00695 [Dehalococcoidales bacterium]